MYFMIYSDCFVCMVNIVFVNVRFRVYVFCEEVVMWRPGANCGSSIERSIERLGHGIPLMLWVGGKDVR